MIITRLYGGLGNQMFQYAIARAYQLRTGIPFLVDTLHIPHTGSTVAPRHYELDNFICNPPVRTVWQRIHKTLVVDERFTTPEKFNTLELDNLELVGYWQDEKYFKNYRKEICADFLGREEWNGFDCKNPVSVHIRRGDYVGSELHPPLDLDYYKRAFEIIESQVKNPDYCVFSDDKEAIKMLSELRVIHPVTANDSDHGYLDLELMKYCYHHIIANSSFSWWGAWLCNFPDKIVVAPKNWFNGREFEGVPKEWVRV